MLSLSSSEKSHAENPVNSRKLTSKTSTICAKKYDQISSQKITRYYFLLHVYLGDSPLRDLEGAKYIAYIVIYIYASSCTYTFVIHGIIENLH